MNESKIQAAIVQYLQSKKIFFHSVPNEAAGRNKVAQMQLVTMGLRAGVADLVVWWPCKEGVSIGYLEVKTSTGVLSPRQKKFLDRCRDTGIRYDVARSVEDVEKMLVQLTNSGDRV